MEVPLVLVRVAVALAGFSQALAGRFGPRAELVADKRGLTRLLPAHFDSPHNVGFCSNS